MKTSNWIFGGATVALYVLVASLALSKPGNTPLDVLIAVSITLGIVGIISAVTLGAIYYNYTGQEERKIIFNNALVIYLRGVSACGVFAFLFSLMVDVELPGIWNILAPLASGLLTTIAMISALLLSRHMDETAPVGVLESFAILGTFFYIVFARPTTETVIFIALLAAGLLFYVFAIAARHDEKGMTLLSFVGGVFLSFALSERLVDFGMPIMYGFISVIAGVLFTGVLSVLMFQNIFFARKLDEKNQNVQLYKAFMLVLSLATSIETIIMAITLAANDFYTFLAFFWALVTVLILFVRRSLLVVQ